MLVDFHIHTTVSDGAQTPHELCRVLNKMGIKAVVTDHDTVKGQEMMLKICPGLTIRNTYAMEVTHDVFETLPSGRITPVHLNVFCPNPFTREEIEKVCGKEPQATCVAKWAKENGCLVQWNHPLYWFYKLTPKDWKHVFFLATANADMVEVWNSNETFLHSFALKYASKLKFKSKFLKEKAEEYGVVFTSNTDSHVPHGIGRALNHVPNYVETFDDLVKAVKKKEVYGSVFKRTPVCGRAWIMSAWFFEGKIYKYIAPLRFFCGIDEQAVEWIRKRWYGQVI